MRRHAEERRLRQKGKGASPGGEQSAGRARWETMMALARPGTVSTKRAFDSLGGAWRDFGLGEEEVEVDEAFCWHFSTYYSTTTIVINNSRLPSSSASLGLYLTAAIIHCVPPDDNRHRSSAARSDNRKVCCGCLVRLSLVLRTRRPALLFRSLFPFPLSRNFAQFSTSSALPRHHSCPFTSFSSSVAIEANQPPLEHSCNSLRFVLLSGNASTYIC